jgi:hypothetical protein
MGFAGIRKKECIQKRRLGRNPRIPFSSEQVNMLEGKFQISPYLSNADVNDLSKVLHLSESRVSTTSAVFHFRFLCKQQTSNIKYEEYLFRNYFNFLDHTLKMFPSFLCSENAS